MLQYAKSGTGLGPYGEKRWVKFPGGYRQFRAVVGLESQQVDLRATGKMLDDLEVTTKVTRSKNPPKGKKTSLAILELTLGFKTQGSDIIANRVESRDRFGRPFAFFTDEEANLLQGFLDALVVEAAGIKSRDSRGRFIRVRL